jgi:hypothetical protein
MIGIQAVQPTDAELESNKNPLGKRRLYKKELQIVIPSDSSETLFAKGRSLPAKSAVDSGSCCALA